MMSSTFTFTSTSTTTGSTGPTTASLGTGLVGLQGTGSVVASTAKPVPTQKGDFLGNSASVEKSNLLMAGFAGAGAIILAWSL